VLILVNSDKHVSQEKICNPPEISLLRSSQCWIEDPMRSLTIRSSMIPFFDPGTPNNFYVFGIDATDLPAYQTRQLIPDPKARYSSPSDWHLLRSGCCAACASAFNRELQITGLPQITLR
jgi:hypothetical protein